MTHVLDSSAIALILKRLGADSVKVFEDNVTLDLSAYELGNLIWKDCALKKLIGLEEAVSRAGQLSRILEFTEIEKLGNDDFKETMKIATRLGLTFYDASYLQVAKRRELSLVTEDRELRKKSKLVGVKAVTVSELLKDSELHAL